MSMLLKISRLSVAAAAFLFVGLFAPIASGKANYAESFEGEVPDIFAFLSAWFAGCPE